MAHTREHPDPKPMRWPWISAGLLLTLIVALLVQWSIAPDNPDRNRPPVTGPASPAVADIGPGLDTGTGADAVTPGPGSSATPALPAPPVLASPADPGPRSSVGIVPVGYQQSEAGAVSAATTYLAVLQELLFTEPSVREAALTTMAAHDANQVTVGMLDALAGFDATVAAGLQAQAQGNGLGGLQGGPFVREVPVAYRLDQYTPGRAQVRVWALAVVLAAGTSTVTEVWSTNTVELVWEDTDWHVWAWNRASGPVPTPSGVIGDPAEQVLAAIGGWEGYRYVPVP